MFIPLNQKSDVEEIIVVKLFVCILICNDF